MEGGWGGDGGASLHTALVRRFTLPWCVALHCLGASLYTAFRAQLHGLLDGGGAGAPQAGAWAAIAVLVSYVSDVVSP